MIKYVGILLFLSLNVQAFVTDVVSNNNQGIEFLKRQNFGKAQDYFSKAMSENPYSTELQLNLGLTFDGIGQPDKAMQSYQQAAKIATDPKLLFAAYFNQAEILGKQKKVAEALAQYQKALEYKPDSIEAKTNIELLTQEQQGDGQGKGDQDKKDQDKKDQKDKDDQKDQEKKDEPDKKDQKKEFGKNKPQPKQFQSPDISKDDAKKILDELDRQEQRVRAEYNKKQRKERPHGKDW